MYTAEQLKAENYLYDKEHGVNSVDVDKINALKALLESELKDSLKPGVIVVCKGEEKTYEGGHLDDTNYLGEYGCHVCVHPSVYVDFSGRDDKKFWFSTSGGYFFSEKDTGKFKFTGKTRLKNFWTFGHNGACGNGGIWFQAEVAVFEYESEKIY